MSWQKLRGPCPWPAVNLCPSLLAWGQAVMSDVPKGCLSHVSPSSHSSDQLCSPGQATSSQGILESSTLSSDASGGMEDYREEPERSKPAKGPAPCLVPGTVSFSTQRYLHVCLAISLLTLPFCYSLSSPKPQSRGGWFDINWPG